MERRRLRGFIRRPTIEEVKRLAAEEYINLNEQEAKELTELIDESLNYCDRIDDLPQPRFEIKYKRDPGYRPTPEEDPYNLFIRKCEVKGAPTGKLAGKRAALKDNIAVAGIPMTDANKAMIDFIPEYDAVVVERLLDEGATIVGKLNQASMSSEPTSETSPFGIVKNPRNPEYAPGGSSSGQGAVVLTGDADIALGVDQGGSGRLPPAWTGVCSIKATHGLVPSFGIYNMDHTVDYICPAARTVEGVALTLEVIAGEDPRDPQWVRNVKKEEYTKALKKGASGLKLGIVKESFEGTEGDVNEAVRKALKKIESEGAGVREVSVPLWQDAWAIWMSIFAHSISVMLESCGQGYFHWGYATPQFAEAFGKARKTKSNEFAPLFILLQVMGKYLRREYSSVYFAKGQNLRHVLRKQIDDLLNEFDVLITPTVPIKALKFLDHRPSFREMVEMRTFNIPQNTCPLNVTGHPAMTIPCGVGEDNLPISTQIIGKHFNESKIFQVAYNFELLGCHWERLGR